MLGLLKDKLAEILAALYSAVWDSPKEYPRLEEYWYTRSSCVRHVFYLGALWKYSTSFY